MQHTAAYCAAYSAALRAVQHTAFSAACSAACSIECCISMQCSIQCSIRRHTVLHSVQQPVAAERHAQQARACFCATQAWQPGPAQPSRQWNRTAMQCSAGGDGALTAGAFLGGGVVGLSLGPQEGPKINFWRRLSTKLQIWTVFFKRAPKWNDSLLN